MPDEDGPPGASSTAAPSAPAARPGLRDAVQALRHRDFALFWVGALITNTGTWVQAIAVPKVVYDLTDSAVLLSLATTLQFAPFALMGPLGGSLADRLDRRTLLLWGQGVQALLALVLWAVWAAGSRSVVLIVALVVIRGFATGVVAPAWQAFVSELVPREALLNAVTLNSTQFNAARAFGPAVGGLVLYSLGAGASFLINAVSFGAVIIALALIRTTRRPPVRGTDRPPVLRAFVDAARYGRERRGILACFIAVGALGGLGSPFTSLLAAYADDVYVVGDQLYGWLNAALGIGAVIAAPVLAGRGSGWRRHRIVECSMIAYGVAMVIVAVSPWYAPAFVGLLVAGAAYLGLASALNTTIQLQVDESMRGKVLAVYVMVLTASLPAGLAVQSLLLRFVPMQATVAAYGVAFVGVYGWMRLRTDLLERLDDERATPAPAGDPA